MTDLERATKFINFVEKSRYSNAQCAIRLANLLKDERAKIIEQCAAECEKWLILYEAKHPAANPNQIAMRIREFKND